MLSVLRCCLGLELSQIYFIKFIWDSSTSRISHSFWSSLIPMRGDAQHAEPAPVQQSILSLWLNM
eukprot:SAG31_NODE_801_length_12013_cov_23.812070_9_plen_65_part_00